MPELPDPLPSDLEAAIEQLDHEILQLIDQRCELVRQSAENEPAVLVGRVYRAAQRLDATLDGVTESAFVSRETRVGLLRHVSSACLQSLHATRAAYLGPMHSYSHLAAIEFFGEGMTLTPVASIPAVFDSVSRGDSNAGIVPIENSTDGRIIDTMGMFACHRETQICGEVVLPIHHQLLSKTPRNEITEVHSKPQALAQCRGWLANHLPGVRLVEVSSTAVAAQNAAEHHGIAAVASIEAGRAYGLDVIDERIEDNSNNVTRFAVLGKETPPATGDDKTALLFQVDHEPGALADAMVVFKDNALNLTWIESFPALDAKNEYLFFVELTGHCTDQAVEKTIDSLKPRTQHLTILGSYPRARG